MLQMPKTNHREEQKPQQFLNKIMTNFQKKNNKILVKEQKKTLADHEFYFYVHDHVHVRTSI